jgi:hypothetical protein
VESSARRSGGTAGAGRVQMSGVAGVPVAGCGEAAGESSAAAKGARVLRELERAPLRPDWRWEADLKYEAQEGPLGSPACSHAGCAARRGAGGTAAAAAAAATTAALLRCARCGAYYCCKACQQAAWKAGHNRECPLVGALGAKSALPGSPAPTCAGSSAWDVAKSHEVLEEMLRRIRMYLCPIAAGFTLIRGEGFVLLRSNTTLAQWIYGDHATDWRGAQLLRTVELQYLTLGEFDGLAFEDDFELAAARPELGNALAAYDKETQVVVLLLLRCGYFALVTIPMVPDVKVARSLAAMYKYTEMEGRIVLNVDETD